MAEKSPCANSSRRSNSFGRLDRANLGAIAASVAFFNINVARILADLDLEAPGWPETLWMSASVMISIFLFRAHSTNLGERMHIAQSPVGKVLSSWAIRPPMAARRIQQVDLEAAPRQIERCLDAGDRRPRKPAPRQSSQFLLLSYTIFRFEIPNLDEFRISNQFFEPAKTESLTALTLRYTSCGSLTCPSTVSRSCNRTRKGAHSHPGKAGSAANPCREIAEKTPPLSCLSTTDGADHGYRLRRRWQARKDCCPGRASAGAPCGRAHQIQCHSG